jgi:hypothetical protein
MSGRRSHSKLLRAAALLVGLQASLLVSPRTLEAKLPTEQSKSSPGNHASSNTAMTTPEGPSGGPAAGRPKTLRKGQRVKRGPSWAWGNQDAGGYGTVTKASATAGWYNVIWDNNCKEHDYRWGYQDRYDLKIEVTGPAAPKCENGNRVPILVGTRVTKGADWAGGRQGGGGEGVIVACKKPKPGYTCVDWDNKDQGQYQWGHDKKFELRALPSRESLRVRIFPYVESAGDDLARKLRAQGFTWVEVAGKPDSKVEVFWGNAARTDLMKIAGVIHDETSLRPSVDKSLSADDTRVLIGLPLIIPHDCGPSAGAGTLARGAPVILLRQRPVNNDMGWTDAMESFVGKHAKVISLSGRDRQGCPLARVDVDRGKNLWRVRDFLIPESH